MATIVYKYADPAPRQFQTIHFLWITPRVSIQMWNNGLPLQDRADSDLGQVLFTDSQSSLFTTAVLTARALTFLMARSHVCYEDLNIWCIGRCRFALFVTHAFNSIALRSRQEGHITCSSFATQFNTGRHAGHFTKLSKRACSYTTL